MEIPLTYTHDGYTFHYTLAAIRSGQRLIGFYFDKNGMPQDIFRNSLYGDHILNQHKDLN